MTHIVELPKLVHIEFMKSRHIIKLIYEEAHFTYVTLCYGASYENACSTWLDRL